MKKIASYSLYSKGKYRKIFYFEPFLNSDFSVARFYVEPFKGSCRGTWFGYKMMYAYATKASASSKIGQEV